MKIKLELVAEVEIPLYLLSYTCPNESCNTEWEQIWCSEVDDTCPECGERNISPADVADMPDEAEPPKDLDAFQAARDQLGILRDSGILADLGIALSEPEPGPARVASNAS